VEANLQVRRSSHGHHWQRPTICGPKARSLLHWARGQTHNQFGGAPTDEWLGGGRQQGNLVPAEEKVRSCQRKMGRWVTRGLMGISLHAADIYRGPWLTMRPLFAIKLADRKVATLKGALGLPWDLNSRSTGRPKGGHAQRCSWLTMRPLFAIELADRKVISLKVLPAHQSSGPIKGLLPLEAHHDPHVAAC